MKIANTFWILIIVLLATACIPDASATLSFSNYAEFTKEGKYGTIDVWDGNIIFANEKIASYTLLDNTDQCLIDCYAIGTAVLLKDGFLFEDLKFLNGKIRDSKVILINGESYETDIFDYKQICTTEIDVNTSKEYQSCNNEQIGAHKEIRYKDIEYNGEILKAGTYNWKIEGIKEINDKVDWIATSNSVDLKQWAWWDAGWSKKKAINVSENSNIAQTGYSVRLNVTYDSDMQADFDDLRFTNGTETAEIGYFIENYTISSSAIVWINTSLTANINNTIYMYYGNAGASTTSNGDKAFLFYDNFNDPNNAVNTTKWSIITNAACAGSRINVSGGNLKMLTANNFTGNLSMIVGMEEVGGSNSWMSATFHSDTATGSVDLKGFSSYSANGNENKLKVLNSTETGAEKDYAYYKYLLNYKRARVTKWGNNGSIYATNITGDWYELDNFQNSTIKVFNTYDTGGIKFEAGNNVNNMYDYIYLMQYAYPEPTIIYGAEEIAAMTITPILISPINYYNTTATSIKFESNATTVNGNFTNATIYLFNATGIIKTNFTAIAGSPDIIDVNLTFSDISNGIYDWTINYCAINASSTICGYAATNRTITIDNISPAITFLYPNASLVYLSSDANLNSSLNFSISDLMIPDTCKYSINGAANVTLTNCKNSTFIISQLGNNSVILWANDSLGNSGYSATSFFAFPTLAICNATINITAVNYTFMDETSFAKLNATLVSSWVYSIYNNSMTVNYSYINTTHSLEYDFCIYPSFANITTSGLLSYQNTEWGYELTQYSFSNLNIGNVSQSITLYLLNSTLSTDLVAKVLDANLVPQKSINVALLRYYPATSTWVNVGNDVSDELGQTIFHVIEKDVNYKFVLSQNGTIIYTTDTVKIVCYANPCQIELTIPSIGGDLFQYYTNASGLSYALSYNNNTQTASVLFTSIDGSPKTVQLLVNQINISNQRIICDNSTTTTTTGLLTCNLSAYTGNFFAQAYVNTSSEMNILDRISISTANFFKTTGTEGLLYSVFFIITLVFIGIWNPVVSIGLACVGFMLLGILGIISLGWAALVSIIILGGIIIWQLKT